MKLKVLILTMTLIVSTSISVFATPLLPTFAEYPYQIQIKLPYLDQPSYLISTQPFVMADVYSMYTPSSGYYHVIYPYSTKGNLNSGTWVNWGEGTTKQILSSTHDVKFSNGNIFFQLPPTPTPMEMGMVGAQSRLLSQFLVILPIILGGVVLFLGLRKALTMLFRSLGKA